MRPCGLLLIAVVCACSGDPTLDLAVHHPNGYGVTQTVVTVYFGGDISCDAIEYGDRTFAELAAITVDEVDVTGGGRIEVDRLGGKSLVARGFDAQHRFVTAGCKDLGEIAGTTKVEIDTQPTAVVAIDPAQPDRPFGERPILVTMSDTNGTALDGMISWQLSGPAGAPQQPASAGMMTKTGELQFRVSDLGVPGPEGLRIRAPWATAPLPLVTAFDLTSAPSISLAGAVSAGLHPSCDVRGHAGKPPTLVCLTQADVGGHRDAVEIAWSGTAYTSTAKSLPATIKNQFAVVVDHDSGPGVPDDSVYVISADPTGSGNWYKLDAPGTGTTVVFPSALQNVVYVPSCQQAGSIAAVGVTTGSALTSSALLEKEQFYTPAGFALSAVNDGEAFSGGCVVDVDGNEHQGVVTTGPSGDPTLYLVADKNLNTQPNPIPTSKLSGTGFVSVTSQGAVEKRFAGTRLQATGTVVFEAVLAHDGNSFKLVERTELDTAAPPTKILGGKLDQDGDTDLMWDMSAGARRRVFQVSLAEQVSGAPLTAMTSGPAGVTATTEMDFAIGDFNGDGVDEMVLYTPTTVTIYSP
jgi:hypothetical protein